MQIKHFLKTATVAGLLLSATSVSAVELGSIMGKREGLRSTVEVEPLPVLLTAVPGVASVGVGGEIFTTPRMAIMAGVSYSSADLSKDFLEDNAQDNPLPDSLQTYRVDIGSRFYNSMTEDSWYWGGKVGYSETAATWQYKDSEVDHNSTHILPSALGGYRWLWDNGFSLRLGGSVGLNFVQSQDVEVEEGGSEAAEETIDNIVNAPVQGQLDFLLGYMF